MEYKKFLIFVLAAILLLAAMMLRVAPHPLADSAVASLLRNSINIGLLIAWGISVRDRAMQPQALKLLMFVTGLMLFIPLGALFTALLLGKSELAQLPEYAAFLTGISVVLFLLVLTNDIHQRVSDAGSGMACGCCHRRRHNYLVCLHEAEEADENG